MRIRTTGHRQAGACEQGTGKTGRQDQFSKKFYNRKFYQSLVRKCPVGCAQTVVPSCPRPKSMWSPLQ
ncbi:unnamed protein product [Timema podura]|uniref:40S ribosomal protein S30 n=1 Tax=Timema podura TaxID=61482 RepID=A0ABN7NHW3_TIMPD|nr:unnamed protein product [Timema podura]